MATVRERILDTLAACAGPICDDCLAERASLRQRQEANQYCRELATHASVDRRRGVCSRCGKEGKLTNTLLNGSSSPVAGYVAVAGMPASSERPWYWEGNVQSRLISWLVEHGWQIRNAADTAARTPGKDVVAVGPEGQKLWVSVKGYPEKSANVQARHWFAEAVFDLILYRNEGTGVQLAVALPDGFKTYLGLADRVIWLRESLPFRIFWVGQDGRVRAE